MELSESMFTILRDLIHEHTGIFYDASKRDLLADKLSLLVTERGFTSFLDYYYLLRDDTASEKAWGQLIDGLANQETYFWREIDAVRVLVDVLVPQWIASHGDQPLRIWSAACASGEEPLTIAMALQEAGWFDRARIEIFASDASPTAISAARQGCYRERSFRSLPLDLRERYFTRTAQGWCVAPELQARVQWLVANLMDERAGVIEMLAGMPVIFCRNMFIYFSDEAVLRTARLFARYMSPDGYLFLGVSESLLRFTDAFELQEIDGAFVYVKQASKDRYGSGFTRAGGG